MAERRDYVQITREEFEDWLNKLKWKWSRKQGRQGVYYVHFSRNVGCAVSATIGRNDAAVGRGKGSMSLSLVSLVTGQTLNRKAKDRKYFQRTKNWMTTWKGGLEHWHGVYQDNAGFYEKIAPIEDRDLYSRDMQKRIEAVPGWEKDRLLASFHGQVGQGAILSDKQVAIIERSENAPPPKAEAPQEASPKYWLELARDLYRAARRVSHDFAMGLSTSMGRMFGAGRDPSEKQWRAFLNLLDEFNIQYDMAQVPGFLTGARRASAKRIAALWLVGREHTPESWAKYKLKHPNADPKNHTIRKAPAPGKPSKDQPSSGTETKPDKPSGGLKSLLRSVSGTLRDALMSAPKNIQQSITKSPKAASDFLTKSEYRTKVLSEAADTLKGGRKKLRKAAHSVVHHAVHEHKEALGSLRKLAKGEPVTKDEAKALLGVAISAGAASVSGVLGASVLAGLGAFGMAVVKHAALATIKHQLGDAFVAYEGGVILTGVARIVSSSEEPTDNTEKVMEKLTEVVLEACERGLREGISEKDLAKAIKG